tara:strand:- start:76 stop:309 length:234 start_codon:yes stop_codon:yes gene_type:complete
MNDKCDPDNLNLLSKEELIQVIQEQASEFYLMKESRDKYFLQNKFHIEEITRLDKIIGEYKKNKIIHNNNYDETSAD